MHLKLPNRRQVAAHRRRELLSLGPQAADNDLIVIKDNDLIVIESAAAATAFKRAFDMPAARLWRLARSDNETLAEIGRSYNVSGWTISRLV
jgi:hypothetical protein